MCYVSVSTLFLLATLTAQVLFFAFLIYTLCLQVVESEAEVVGEILEEFQIIETIVIQPYISHSCPAQSVKKDLEFITKQDLDELTATESRYQHSQEDLVDYCYGGYMPIVNGDVLNNTYSVIRKLGFGQFSTVWLCKNLWNKSYVAIKTGRALMEYEENARDEIKLLRQIASKDPTHPGHKRFIQLLDSFQAETINGVHFCLVFEAMGPSLLYLLEKSEFKGIKLACIRPIMKQIFEGLQYLHDVCGIIHTDLKPENILIKVKESYIRKMDEIVGKYKELGVDLPRSYVNAQQYAKLKRDTKRLKKKKDPLGNIRTESHESYKPKLKRKPTFNGPIWVDAIEVKIADLGNACMKDRHYHSIIQTRQYRALEVIIESGYDTKADLWSVGCIAFELATGEFLFTPKAYEFFNSDEDHLGLIWELLGGIPKYISLRGAKSNKFFDENGHLLHIQESHLKIWKLEDVLVEKYAWKRVDAIPFSAFVLGLIEPDPALRYDATEALNSQWMNMDQE